MDRPEPQSQPDRPLVLVIDDSIDVHRLLTARLRSEAIELRCFESGLAGLEAARAHVPSTILLDLNMEGMDGFEVLRALKDSPRTSGIPVIVLSGLSNAHDKVTAFDLGAHDYVTKPFEFVELRVRVRAALRLDNLLRILATRAQVDGLSGLWNRAYFDARWKEETATAARHARPLSLAVLDLDHFKSINDTFGHPAGDAVIEGFARLITASARSSDIACRYGGEEFCLIMPETAPEDAATLCERIRERLGQRAWPRHPERRVTASVGIAGASGASAVDAAGWIERADQALYTAKREGRDRVVVTDVSGGPKLARSA